MVGFTGLGGMSSNAFGGGGGGGGSGGGGSNMVSRDDTAAMHRLIARWLRGEVEGLVRRAADSGMLLVERARVVRALLHSLGVLAAFFRCVDMMSYVRALLGLRA